MNNIRRAYSAQRRGSRGITLLETIVVMGIVAILLAVGIPSFLYVTTSNRIASEVNALLGDLQYARAEAIKEGQNVTVCVSSDGATCKAAGTTAWNDGWIVFSDVNGDATVDAGDIVLHIQAPFTSTDTFTASNTISSITFNREGFASGPTGFAAGSLITLHAATPATSTTRCLAVTMVGLATTLTSSQTANGFTCT